MRTVEAWSNEMRDWDAPAGKAGSPLVESGAALLRRSSTLHDVLTDHSAITDPIGSDVSVVI
jgi:hypothetical protein